MTFGGPIVKNRAFFFTDWEGFRERQKFAVFSNLPTVNERQGIFGVAVRNPLTGEVLSGQYADSSGSRSRRLPAVFWQICRCRTLEVPVAPPTISKIFAPTRTTTTKCDLKLDGQVNSKVTAFVRFSHRKSNILQAPDIPGPSGGGGNGFIRALNQQLAAGVTFAASPTSLLEASVWILQDDRWQGTSRTGRTEYAFALRHSWPLRRPTTHRRTHESEYHRVTAFGRQATNPQWQYPYVYNPKVNYSRIVGKALLEDRLRISAHSHRNSGCESALWLGYLLGQF